MPKKSKENHRSIYSEEILIHPDGSTNIENLENLLDDLTIDKVKPSTRVLITKEERVKRFNPSSPEYKKTSSTRTFSELLDLYFSETGRNYVEPTPEQRAREQERRYSRSSMIYR